MSPIGRLTTRVLPQRAVDLSTPQPTPPRVVETSRTDDISGSAPSPPAKVSSSSGARRDHEVDVRTLIVGRGVSFSGAIGSCDQLIVEGTLQANTEGCENVTIAETGVFGGYASAEDVDVLGRFEGDLVVRRRLLIRTTGHVVGRITYREIEIERGGQISGVILALEDDGVMPDRGARRRRKVAAPTPSDN